MSAASLEREFFRTLNRVVEPMVRAGFGSPRIVPGGLIVLETLGRRVQVIRRQWQVLMQKALPQPMRPDDMGCTAAALFRQYVSCW